MAGKRRRQKTWSLYTERRKPSEYEIVTHKLNYHFRREPAPFELDPDTPINKWYLKHREGSRFQVDDWDGFRDPARLTYRGYIKRQQEREVYLDNLIDEFERKDHYANLSTEWVKLLEKLYLPSRFSGHALQMLALYVSQMAPSSYITVAFHFQGADEMRRVQRVAYLAKALSLDHYEELADSKKARRIWEEDPSWQPMREFLEKLLVTYDWGEAFAALGLVAKPAYDALFDEQFSELARRNGDELLALMSEDFNLDAQRHREVAKALVNYAVGHNPELQGLLNEWVGKWAPLARRAVEGLSSFFGEAPQPIEPEKVADAVDQSLKAFWEECRLSGREEVHA